MKMKNESTQEKAARGNVLERLGGFFSDVSLRWMPDAFIFALILTLLTMVMAAIFTPKGPADIVFHWSERFWGVLKFSMQSSYGLMLCTMLAMSPVFRAGFVKLAALPRTHFQVQLLNVVVATLLLVFHWGMLVAAGLFAREIAIASKKKGLKVHYPLLVAGAYAGLLPWHVGLSGASQLLIATPGNFLEKTIGLIPTSQTLFHVYSYGGLILLSIVAIGTIVLMTPRKKIEELPEEVAALAEMKPLPKVGGIWDNILDNKILGVALGGVMIIAILVDMIGYGRGWDLNVFIFVLYALSLVIHMSLRTFGESIFGSVRSASQIFLQFQFYGGIMGLMVWSGLAMVIAGWFASLSTQLTWPFWNFVQAGVVNMFVPSGGGQFTATAPIIIETSKMIGTPLAPTVMTTFAFGDQLTNMIQPFWILPILGVAGLALRRVMGYAAVVLVAGFIATTAWIFIVTPLMGLL
jgi:short-chain fatty acids transporter